MSEITNDGKNIPGKPLPPSIGKPETAPKSIQDQCASVPVYTETGTCEYNPNEDPEFLKLQIAIERDIMRDYHRYRNRLQAVVNKHPDNTPFVNACNRLMRRVERMLAVSSEVGKRVK